MEELIEGVVEATDAFYKQQQATLNDNEQQQFSAFQVVCRVKFKNSNSNSEEQQKPRMMVLRIFVY